jgi:hypothetical protein
VLDLHARVLRDGVGMSQRQVKALFGPNVHSRLVVCPSKKTLSVQSEDWSAVTCKHCLKAAPKRDAVKGFRPPTPGA